MRPSFRSIVFLVLLFASGAAQAQTYPSQTVKIVVPFPPGGGFDVVARMIAPKLGEQLGQSVIIENRGGAGGSLGATAVAQAPRDGYTLLLGTASTRGTNPNVYAKLPYEPVGRGPEVLAAKVQAERRKWTTIVREKNIRIEQ